MAELTSFEAKCLARSTGRLLVYSDVFPDHDAMLTTADRHLIEPSQLVSHPLDDATPYYAELVAQTHDMRLAEIRSAERRAYEADDFSDVLHPTVQQARNRAHENAVRVILNCAPRNGEEANGRDFHLAILDNGVEFYAVPLALLRYVRRRVVSLFRIPTKGHPLFDGAKEQFRSSIIGRTCEVPNHLERVYGGDAAFTPIPDQAHPMEVAYADHFGNLRVRARDLSAAMDSLVKMVDDRSQVCVTLNGVTQFVHARTALALVPGSSLGIFHNVADGTILPGQPGYVELVRRWPDGGGFGDCATAHHTFEHAALGSPVTFSPIAREETFTTRPITGDAAVEMGQTEVVV